jgi:hypothetical protein
MQREINKSYLNSKKVLLLSDTHYPHLYIKDFLKYLDASNVYVYVSPATTSKFIKVYLKVFAHRNATILKDKKYKIFFDDAINNYIVVIFFGKKATNETQLLEKLAKKLILCYQDVIVVTHEGIDYDEDSSLFVR